MLGAAVGEENSGPIKSGTEGPNPLFFLQYKRLCEARNALRDACLQSACGARDAQAVEQAGRGLCRSAAADCRRPDEWK